jgi:rRNA processing protein Gar1
MENLTKPVSNIIEGTKSVVSNIIEDVKTPVSNIVNEGVTLGEGLIEKGIEKVGDVVGVDVTQPQIIENKLNQIENVISNPEIKKEIGKIVEVAGEAMDPYIKPLEEKVIEKTKEVGKELGTSAVQIGLNTAEEIPGVGVVIGTLRSLDQAAKAGLSTVNAFVEVSKDTTDAINATAKNYKRLMEEKNKIGQRINNSVSTFNNPQSLITNQLKPSNIISKKIGGGISNKKKYIKSKKYTRKYK